MPTRGFLPVNLGGVLIRDDDERVGINRETRLRGVSASSAMLSVLVETVSNHCSSAGSAAIKEAPIPISWSVRSNNQ